MRWRCEIVPPGVWLEVVAKSAEDEDAAHAVDVDVPAGVSMSPSFSSAHEPLVPLRPTIDPIPQICSPGVAIYCSVGYRRKHTHSQFSFTLFCPSGRGYPSSALLSCFHLGHVMLRIHGRTLEHQYRRRSRYSPFLRRDNP